MSKGRRGREGRKTRKKRVNEGSPYGQPGSLATRESLRDGVENTSELLKGKETGTNLSISSFQWSGLLVGHSLSASHLPCVVTEHTGQEPEHCQLERCRKPPIDKGTSMLVSSWGRGGVKGLWTEPARKCYKHSEAGWWQMWLNPHFPFTHSVT